MAGVLISTRGGPGANRGLRVTSRDVRHSRQALGLSQEQFARRLGVSFATVNRWERGRSAPRRAAVAKLAAVRLLASGQAPDATDPDGSLRRRVPAGVNRFVGRDDELRRLAALARTSRLITVTGPGGAGKTRLALEAVERGAIAPAARVVFASLEGIDDVHEVAPAVLRQVREPGTTPRGGLAELLADGDQVLILDNCEHLLSSARELAAGLLASCPRLAILATSRESLGIRGERVLRLGPLATAGGRASGDAVELFIDRAAARAPGYEPSAADREVIAAICARLDGLPLAIELAAGWVPERSPAEILASLGRSGLAAARGRAGPGRQQTLGAAMAWSYELLLPAERRLFERLAVFPASFGLEAAEAVAGEESLLDLAALVGKSMVEVRGGNGSRYVLLETLREFGRERLAAGEEAEADDAWRALADWCLAFSRRAERGMVGREQADWLRSATLEADSVRAAISWAVEARDAARAVELAGAFWRYWYSRSELDTGFALLTLALGARGAVPPAVRAAALLGAGVIARQRGDLQTAARLLREHLAAASDAGDDRAVAEAQNSLAGVLHRLGDSDRARRLLVASLDWWERSRDRRGMATALSNLGLIAADTGDLAAAREYGEAALSIRLELGHEEGIAISFENLAGARLAAGATDESRALYAEALRRYAALDEPDGIVGSLEGIAVLAPAAHAVVLAAIANAARAMIAVPRSAAEQAALDTRLDAAHADLGAAAFDAARARGAGLDLAAGIDIALSWAGRPDGSRASWHLRRHLSRREREVLWQVTQGHTSKEIAARLRLSSRTVERHLGNIYAKIGARGRADAIAVGLKMGLSADVSPSDLAPAADGAEGSQG